MKTKSIFLFFLFLALSFVLFSAPAELDIRMADNSTMIVVIDQYEFDENAGRYHIRDLSHGNHSLEVYRISTHGFGPNAPIFTELFYRGNIWLQGGFLTYAEVDASGRLHIIKKISLNSSPHGNNNGYYNNNGNHYGHYNGNGNHSHVSGTYGYGNGYGNGYGSNYGYGMDPGLFMELKRTIALESFDSHRLDLAKFAVSGNRLSSAQIFELTSLFTFESNKLEFAKYAFHYVTDPGSYFIVANAFTFSSSKRELFDYIGLGSGY